MALKARSQRTLLDVLDDAVQIGGKEGTGKALQHGKDAQHTRASTTTLEGVASVVEQKSPNRLPERLPRLVSVARTKLAPVPDAALHNSPNTPKYRFTPLPQSVSGSTLAVCCQPLGSLCLPALPSPTPTDSDVALSLAGHLVARDRHLSVVPEKYLYFFVLFVQSCWEI